jgi:hypothetical protein
MTLPFPPSDFERRILAVSADLERIFGPCPPPELSIPRALPHAPARRPRRAWMALGLALVLGAALALPDAGGDAAATLGGVIPDSVGAGLRPMM